jgi:hypothetical protein
LEKFERCRRANVPVLTMAQDRSLEESYDHDDDGGLVRNIQPQNLLQIVESGREQPQQENGVHGYAAAATSNKCASNAVPPLSNTDEKPESSEDSASTVFQADVESALNELERISGEESVTCVDVLQHEEREMSMNAALEAVRTLYYLMPHESNAEKAVSLKIASLLQAMKGLFGPLFDILSSQVIYTMNHNPNHDVRNLKPPSPLTKSSPSSLSLSESPRPISEPKSFSDQRSDHEARLLRLHDSPLSPGQEEAGDTRDGYGVKLFADGTLYAGDFQAGLRSGYGVQRWRDGHVYRGQWKLGKREGEGEYRFSHGDSDGSGMIEDHECDIYKGEWLNDMFHGTGVYRFMGGDVYTGQFRENEKYGVGTYISADGWPR